MSPVRRLVRWTRDPRTWLRAVIVVCVLLAGGLAVLSGGRVGWFAPVLLVGAGLAFARWPGTAAGHVAMAVVLYEWAVLPGRSLPLTVLPAAVLLVVAHVAGLLAAHTRGAVPDAALVRTWATRVGGVSVLALPVWAVGRLGLEHPAEPLWWVAGLVLVAGGLVLAVVLERQQP